MVNTLDCRPELSDFELYSRYYVPFQTNNIEKGIEHHIPEFWVK